MPLPLSDTGAAGICHDHTTDVTKYFQQSVTFRLLIPMFPLAGALAVPRSRVYRVVLVTLFIVGQWVWCYYCWWVDGTDWTPP